MNIWICIAIIGAIFVIIGAVLFIRKTEISQIKKSTFLTGIFLPIVSVLSYAETVKTEIFLRLDFLDVGIFYFMGMISGFFIALYLQKRKIYISKK